MLFLAEQAAEGGLKVLPGKSWGLHYPVPPEVRSANLEGLLKGTHKANEVAHSITPDALFYDPTDIQTQGLENVSARVRDLSAFVTYYDYPRFARFVESMKGRDIPLADIDGLYSEITQARTQKKVLDAYGLTGRQQIEKSLRSEAENVLHGLPNLTRSEKVLKTLKLDWLAEDLGLVATEERDRAVSQLSGDERKLFNNLQSPYRDYVKSGAEQGYDQLVKTAQEGFPKIQKETEGNEPSESMQELQKELDQFKDKTVPPGTPEDPAIPPEDNDEYHTPPAFPGESTEKRKARPIFEIAPPLGGYYASGRKSYFDVDSKTWSKKKRVTAYNSSIQGKERSTISGVIDKGLKSLPTPNGYALDAASLADEGAGLKILRDQNGCFYLQSDGSGSFSVDFLKESTPHVGPPVPEDTAQLYRGTLSAKTEFTISRMIGSAIQKAEAARQCILANHFYPGGGDLQAAQAVQYKLRSESTGDTYLQNIDASEYLECYSANTKFIAMMRKAGIPARLVVGHKVEGAKDGKSAIDESTGHAWSEIWDGQAWRRFDATPPAKPEDKKDSSESDKDSQKQGAGEAQDGGIDSPQKQQESGQGDKAEKQGQKGQGQPSPGSQNPLEQMPDASDRDMQQAQSKLEQAKEQVEKMMQQKQQLDDRVDTAKQFQDIAELQKELESSELFDDLKKDLEDKLESKQGQMKDVIKDSLDKMVEDGFMDEQTRDKIEKELEQKAFEQLDRVQKEIERENRLYVEYDNIREEVMPLVEQWFRYFAERLPRQDEVELDEDSLTRQGAFNRRSVMRPRNLLFGMVKNPREIKPSIKPRFMASMLVDVSRSMEGTKLQNARKLLVFYSELFSRISDAFGYIRFSIDIFSDGVTQIKGFGQDYDSPTRYDFGEGTPSTVKLRLMQRLTTQGGTNMLDGIQKSANDLNKEVAEYPDYASAFYFVGDGGDTRGNAPNIRKFLSVNDTEHGFCEHMYSAILLGNEAQRQELAAIFGDEHTNVAPNFDLLIERSMEKFDDDLEEYLRTKTR